MEAEAAGSGPGATTVGGEGGGRLAELAAVAGRMDGGPERDAAFVKAAREALSSGPRSRRGSFSGRAVAVARGVVARELRGPPGGPERAATFLQGLLPEPQEKLHLAPLHADFVRCCLLSRRHLDALPLLEQELSDFSDRKSVGLTVRDFLLFHYYGGVTFLGLRRYSEALQFFAAVLATPAQAESAITEAAWKKFLAASLILHGRHTALPKYCSKVVSRQVKKCKAYEELRVAFLERDPASLRRVVAAHQEHWEKDGNLGLIKLCASAQTRSKVKLLARAYVNLQLDVFAQKLGLPGGVPEAERLLLRMVTAGELSARIDQVRGVVTFAPQGTGAGKKGAPETLEALREGLARATAVGERVRAVNNSLSLDKKFISKSLAVSTKIDAYRSGGDSDMGPFMDFAGGVGI